MSTFGSYSNMFHVDHVPVSLLHACNHAVRIRKNNLLNLQTERGQNSCGGNMTCNFACELLEVKFRVYRVRTKIPVAAAFQRRSLSR